MMCLEILGFLNLSIIDILDILMVAVIIYLLFKWLKGSSAMNIFLVILLLFLVRIIADALNMKMMTALMKTVLDVGVVAIIIIFQPEIRRFLMGFGTKSGLARGGLAIFDKLLGSKESKMDSAVVKEIASACKKMGEEKTGALIAIPGRNSLSYIVETGDKVDALVSRRLIMNIFFKNSPLHDGAMVIGRDRIVAARCTLPITTRQDIPAHYGMRHKAAIGLTEETDAVVIVVSEETGHISYVHKGEIETIDSVNRLTLLLGTSLKEDNDGTQQ